MKSKLDIKDKTDELSPLKISLFRTDIRKTNPHKHNSYFEIVYLSKGSGFHAIDSIKYAVNSPVVFIIRKEQVHYWELKSKPKGYVMIIKKEFLDNTIDKELKDIFSDVSAFNCLYLKDGKAIEQVFALLSDEYDPAQLKNSPIITGLIKVLLAKIVETSLPAQPATKMSATLFYRFHELLSRDKALRNSVAHYASLLNTTPQNLNTICRKAAGQSSAKVLATFIVNEAKRLLLYTDMTISEIAYALSFSDNSHFVKYFKRHAGLTPQSFRTQV